MLLTLIKKEMLANMTSLKFVLTLLLVTVIFIVGGFVFVGRYKQEVEDFRDIANKNLSTLREASENLSAIPSHFQTIRKQPKIMRLCCEGFEKSLPNTFMMNGFTISNPNIVSRTNFLLPRFADIDWAFIISFILSFVAFILTFDSISAEKERGTLSLIMSNSVPRDKVILGKYISAMLMLIIPLFVGLLFNLIIVNLFGLSSISGSQWLKIPVFLGVSILYLSAFVLLGILVSSRSARSSSSIAISLFMWVTITMIIPSTGRIIAERFLKVPTYAEVERQIEEAEREIWQNSDRYGKNAGAWDYANPHVDWVNPPARARLMNAITDSQNRIKEEHINKMVAQVSLGRNLTRISPTMMYQCASEAIVGTGISRFRNLYNQLKRYKKALKDFVMSTDRKDSDSFHLWAENRMRMFAMPSLRLEIIDDFSSLKTGASLMSPLGLVGCIGMVILIPNPNFVFS